MYSSDFGAAAAPSSSYSRRNKTLSPALRRSLGLAAASVPAPTPATSRPRRSLGLARLMAGASAFGLVLGLSTMPVADAALPPEKRVAAALSGETVLVKTLGERRVSPALANFQLLLSTDIGAGVTPRGFELSTGSLAPVDTSLLHTAALRVEPLVAAPVGEVERQPLDILPPDARAEPLTSPHAVTTIRYRGERRAVNKLQRALDLSAERMRGLNLTADSIIAWHAGRPILLRDALRDKDIHQIPSSAQFADWQACLARNGFNRAAAGDVNYAEVERRYGLPRNAMHRIVARETGQGYDCAVSWSRREHQIAEGRFQTTPEMREDYDLTTGFDPQHAKWGVGRYLRDAFRTCRGNFGCAAAAYNGGIGRIAQNLRRNGGVLNVAQLPAETRGYIVEPGQRGRKVRSNTGTWNPFGFMTASTTREERPARRPRTPVLAYR